MSLRSRLGYDEDEPLVRVGKADLDHWLSAFSVSLPHSCDSWQITREKPTKVEALEDLDEFIAMVLVARRDLESMEDLSE